MTGLPETLARPYDLFGRLAKVPADALLGLIALYRADAPPDKIDLGVGVFRDDGGATPVMRAVKSAEAEILATQISKSYLGAEGDARYTELLAKIALGEKLACSPRITGVQTPGGTGALRLGAEFVKRAAPDATVWIGEPTWPNHGPIFLEAGLRVKAHRFYDVAAAAVDIDAMIEDLGAAAPGDILLLHGCCHNPTGAELDAEAWQRIATLCEERQLTPFVDLAYQGLGNGLEADAGPTRALFAALPAAILAYSCDKNFGLYRERVGALWIQGAEGADLEAARGNILALARSLWSMPPDHGAAIVRVILDDAAMRAEWHAELDAMRERINILRRLVAEAHPKLAFIGKQRGMFAMLPISPDAVAALRSDHGIYMAGNGRINIAGLTETNVARFVACVSPHL